MGTINLWLIGILSNITGYRGGRVSDPFGNIWWIQTHLKDVTPEETARLFQDPKELSIMQKMQETFVKEMDKRLK